MEAARNAAKQGGAYARECIVKNKVIKHHERKATPPRSPGRRRARRRNTKYDYARNMSGRYASPPETRDHSLGRPRWDASLRGVNADRGL